MYAQQLNQTVDQIVETPASSRGLTSWLKRHPLVGYFTLAYAGTWLTLAPVVLSKSGVGALPYETPFPVFAALFILSGFLGPTLAAFVMTGITTGKAGVRLLLKRYVQWRVGVQWYALVLFGYVALNLLVATAVVGVGPLGALGGKWPLIFTLYLPTLFTFNLVTSLGEEPGWRGFALPRGTTIDEEDTRGIAVRGGSGRLHFTRFDFRANAQQSSLIGGGAGSSADRPRLSRRTPRRDDRSDADVRPVCRPQGLMFIRPRLAYWRHGGTRIIKCAQRIVLDVWDWPEASQVLLRRHVRSAVSVRECVSDSGLAEDQCEERERAGFPGCLDFSDADKPARLVRRVPAGLTRLVATHVGLTGEAYYTHLSNTIDLGSTTTSRASYDVGLRFGITVFVH